ncbi:MAG: hypothetical protein PHI68_03195, partial [Candidatus Cloacimonetes bacterium]|nr:hypothetical protein [Candidatus Cloacimonadota bacterium]
MDDLVIKTKAFERMFGSVDPGIDTPARVSCLLSYCSTLISHNKKEQALDLLEMHEAILHTVEDQVFLLESYESIAGLYNQLAQHKKAYDFLRMYAETEDKLFVENLSRKLSEYKKNFEMEKRQYESMNIIDMASRLASIGVIVGGITHEINQPLSAINVNADSVLYWNKHNPGYLPEIIVRSSTEISHSSKKIDQIISHMRKYWTSVEPKPTDKVE